MMHKDNAATRSVFIKLSLLAFAIYCGLSNLASAEDDIQFNTDVLDVKDKENIDLSRFSKGNYIMPGDYSFKILVNQNELEEQPVSVYVSDKNEKETMACITP
ncbi:FimD/PapC N-terminal domain-containing protein, partial [Enterobacter cloacae complex sp. P6RS]|nr:FimD/PapC N-terminal domain-containing protein [Enterobacter cloacae complex sp. P6RS]